MKILYVFSGQRKKNLNKILKGKIPDTQLYGLNYFNNSFLEAEINELPYTLRKIFGFSFYHFLYFFKIFKYKIIFGPSLLYSAGIKRLITPNKKYILFNISLNRTLSLFKKSKLRRKYIEFSLKGIDRIICLSNIQKNELIKKFKIKKEIVSFIPFGVDVNYFNPIYRSRGDNILSVGGDNGRDYKTVIEVARKMSEEKFVIICRPRNINRILNIPKNVKVIYNLPLEEIKKFYQNSKLLLLITHPDNYRDGADCSGQTVLLESMACGLPVIASKKNYLQDYVVKGEDYLEVDSYKIDDIINKIKQLNNKALALQISQNARKKIEMKYSTEQLAKNLENFFINL